MKLSLFEESISTKILSRGKNYFDNSLVMMTNVDDDYCRAEVDGTYTYEVEIYLEGDGITDTYCNCPDEYNDPCKHIVATLFALREELNKPIKQPNQLKEQLETLSKKQLIQLIENIAKHNPTIKKTIQYQLNPNSYAIPQAKETILHAIKVAKGRYNYIPHYLMDEALEGIYTVLADADPRISNKEPLIATKLVVLCYEQLLSLQNYDDDENEMPAAFAACHSMINQILSKEVSKEIFNSIAELLLKNWHDFEDARIKLFISLTNYATSFSDEITQLFPQLLATCNSMYDKQQLLDIEYESILQANDAQLLQQFFDTYKNFSTIRKKAIYYAMEQQQIDQAIKLTKQGILQDQDNRGVLTQWQRLLFSLYEMQDNTTEMEPLAIDLLLNGQQEFYNELQYIAKDWLSTQEMVLNQLSKKNRDVYTAILVEHHLTERLLTFCQDNPMEVFRFLNELKLYEEDILLLVRTMILQLVEKGAASRSNYQSIAAHLKKVKAAGYVEETTELILEIISLYPRKKALIDELQYV